MTHGQKSAKAIREITISVLRDVASGKPRYSATQLREVAKDLAKALACAEWLAGAEK